MKKSQPSIKAQFKKFLKSYNCKFEDEVDKESGTWTCYFDFQGGHFVASVKKADHTIDVTYPQFHTSKMENIQMVRAVCNRFNSNNTLFKFVYTCEPDDGELSLHASFFNNKVDDNEMAGQLSAIFYFTRELVAELQRAIAKARDEDTDDVERTFAERTRELSLMARQEITHDADKWARDETDGGDKQHHITVSTLVKTLLSQDDEVNVLELQPLYPTSGPTIKTPSRILAYDLTRHLIEGRGKSARFVDSYGQLVLRYHSHRHDTDHLLSINIKTEGEDDSALYMRLTVACPPYPVSRQCSMDNELRMPRVFASMIAYDRGTLKKRLQEVDYMWQDARLRLRDKQELTDEQLLLRDIEDPQMAYNAYCGRKDFIAGRYLSALQHYENLFNAIKKRFYDFDKETRMTFFNLCYDIGFCYNELGMYKQAYYYLQYVEDDGNIRHSTELINTLANSSDVRFFKLCNEIMEAVNENFPDADEMPENIAGFVNFLRRRHAYTLIDFNKLDDAEKEFTQMLDEPDNSDYAIDELAYIKQLRRRQAAKNGQDTKEGQEGTTPPAPGKENSEPSQPTD